MGDTRSGRVRLAEYLKKYTTNRKCSVVEAKKHVIVKAVAEEYGVPIKEKK